MYRNMLKAAEKVAKKDIRRDKDMYIHFEVLPCQVEIQMGIILSEDILDPDVFAEDDD